MKKRNIFFGLGLGLMALLSGCGGGNGGSSGSSGTISMNVTDAKPMLPTTGVVESVTITFDEVSVHKSGGGWITLPMATQLQAYEIDLYQFSDGAKTQFVPPAQLSSGKYTQVRIGVTSGILRISGQNHQLEIPSTNLKTDKNFEFNVPDKEAVDLTVDFDLSQSIVVTGTGTYQLKPVLHINQTSQAATIQGTLSFSNYNEATVTVYRQNNGDTTLQDPNAQNPVLNPDEVYTSILVKNTDDSPFKVFWLVPNESYHVKVQLPNGTYLNGTYEEYVEKSKLQAGAVHDLNGGNTI